VEAWAVTEFQDDLGWVCHWTLDLEFFSIFGNGFNHFPGDDFHISRNGVTQMDNEALWEAAAHTNKLQHKLLHNFYKAELLQDDFGHLGDDFGHGLEHFARRTS